MPEAMTHFYFANDVIRSLDDKYKNLINIDESRIFLYSNLHDLPYYFNLYKMNKKDNLKLGYKLHNVKTSDVIETIINYIRNNGFDRDNILLLYSLVSHYVLDKIMHPYINSLSGIYRKDNRLTKKYRGTHGLIERAIDSTLVKENEYLDLAKINLVKKFKGAFIFTFNDLEILDHTIKNNYYFSKTSELYKISLKKFKKFMNYTSHDFIKIKSILYKINDLTFNRKSNHLTYNFLYQSKYNIGDFMNESHQIWLNPVSGLASNLSFKELYNIAKNTCMDYLSAVNSYLYLNNSKQFHLLFDNSSLDTGSKADINEMKYESVLKK